MIINSMLFFSRLIGIICAFYLTGCYATTPNPTISAANVPQAAASPSLVANRMESLSESLPITTLKRFTVRTPVTAEVYLEETVVVVRAGQTEPVSLETIYLPLYQQWQQHYFKIGDYDGDGWMDLAVLQSVGHVGQNRCYAIYRYDASKGQFRTRKSFDRCGI